MYVVVAKEQSVRPPEMSCCWVLYEKPWPPVPGRVKPVARLICPADCRHSHHRYEAIMAAVDE
jgi:hypothetical protein